MIQANNIKEFLAKFTMYENITTCYLGFTFRDKNNETLLIFQESTEGGWDYTLYKILYDDIKEVDGGIYGDENTSAYAAMEEILAEAIRDSYISDDSTVEEFDALNCVYEF